MMRTRMRWTLPLYTTWLKTSGLN
uniref:F-box/kelch-repeat protein At1g15670-like n=1 Tax=Rhizophora mucronata TaxID=61149 RepID=A0A2P2P4E2_RHIMU